MPKYSWRLVFVAGHHCYLVHANGASEHLAESVARATLFRDLNIPATAKLRSVERINANAGGVAA